MLFSERPPIYTSSGMTISGGRTEQHMCCSVLSPEIVMPDAYICRRLRWTKITRKASDAAENLQLYRLVRFFHRRSPGTMTHISADVQRITLNASCMMISGERTEQLDIFCRVTGFTSDFLSYIDVQLIRFFHGALQLYFITVTVKGCN